MGLIQQEVSAEPDIDIPDAVREAYALWRPTPLRRARRFEQALGTNARIFYKYEGVSPAGSHKPNTAVAQAYENAQAGVASSSPRRAPASGARPRVRVLDVRPRVRGLHGRRRPTTRSPTGGR